MKTRSRARSLIKIASLQSWGPRATSIFFAVLALCFFALSSANPDRLKIVRTGTFDLFAPVLAAVNYPLDRAALHVRSVTGLASLQSENAALKQENERLRAWYHTAMQLQSENRALQTLLKVRLEPQHTYISARIVADSDNAYARSVLVMAGKMQGVDSLQAVLAGEGLIGRVVEAGNRASRVLLLTDINARVPVLVGEGGVRAMLAGNNTDMPEIIHLPPSAVLKDGERITTSGHGGIYPYGLPVGEVVKGAGGVWRVRLYGDIDRATYVRVVRRGEDENLVTAPEKPE